MIGASSARLGPASWSSRILVHGLCWGASAESRREHASILERDQEGWSREPRFQLARELVLLLAHLPGPGNDWYQIEIDRRLYFRSECLVLFRVGRRQPCRIDSGSCRGD